MKLATSLIAVALAKERNAPTYRNENTVVDNCGGSISASQTIKSPGFDAYGYYYNNLSCVWTIDMPNAAEIFLVPVSFELESHSSCSYDAVRINGADGSSIAGPFCGAWDQEDGRRKRRQAAKDPNERPAPRTGLPLTDNIRLYNGDSIVFTTDHSVVRDGFEFNIVTDLGSTDACQQSLSGSGVVTSPNHPLDYENGASCAYTLNANAGEYIKITMTHWDVESHSSCGYDALTIDGTSYCGRDFSYQNAPAQEIIVAAESTVVSWTTDGSVVGTGFSFTFESVDPADLEPDNADQEPAAFWNNFRDFYTQTKAQMEAGDRPWKTPHFTWMFNQLMNHGIETQSQLEGECTWATETGNQHPTYELVTVESFNPDVDRCINLMTMADMGLDYIESYVCMTGHAKPRGTLRRYNAWMTGIRTLGEWFCPQQ